MIVVIGSEAVVGEADNLGRLHVEAADDAHVDAALQASGLGYLEGDHAWLSVAALRKQSGEQPADWPERYDAMVGYAVGKGWCTADGTHLRAHIERTHGEAPA